MDPRRDLHPRLPFALQVVKGDSVASIMAIGEVRGAQVELLRRCVRALGGRGVAQVVIDMKSVTFVSPAARRALTSLPAPGVDVFLQGLQGPARRQLSQRHARSRIRLPRIQCPRCPWTPQISLPRRF